MCTLLNGVKFYPFKADILFVNLNKYFIYSIFLGNICLSQIGYFRIRKGTHFRIFYFILDEDFS